MRLDRRPICPEPHAKLPQLPQDLRARDSLVSLDFVEKNIFRHNDPRCDSRCQQNKQRGPLPQPAEHGGKAAALYDRTVAPAHAHELRRARQAASNYRYAKSWLALALPVAYCLLDAAGTFADSRVLTRLDPDAANCAYELTFLFAAAVSFVYVKFIRHDRFLPKREGPKYVGALFETAGQFAYIYAIADEDHVMYAAPIISAYCAASVLWSRIFLREKLSWRHYLMLLLIVVGIVLIGILDL